MNIIGIGIDIGKRLVLFYQIAPFLVNWFPNQIYFVNWDRINKKNIKMLFIRNSFM